MQEELPVAALVVVVMVEDPGRPVGRSGFDDGYLRAHLMPILGLIRGSLAEWSSTLMTMRARLSA